MVRNSQQVHAKGRCPLAVRGTRFPRGFTILELIGACMLLGILLSTAVPMFAIVARERLMAEQRQFAMQHAANLLEQGRQRDWSELNPGTLSIPDSDENLMSVLPGIERSLDVQPVEGETESRQLVVSVRWKDRGGQFIAPIRLSAWVYRAKETP